MLNIKPKFVVLVLSAFLLMSGCASVPPEVVQAHQVELERIESLKTSHLAMVDAYLKNWKSSFKQLSSRDYDENKDFPVLYSDLVVEYQEAIKPIETMRNDLKRSIKTEFTNAILAHMAINKWIKSINSLQAANKAVIDKILGGIKPGLSLDTIDKKVETVKKELEEKLNNL
jgi:PBP1b-binding outer membrane lipoprotein LpoB